MTPLYTAELFVPLHVELEALLGGLKTEDWERPTVAKTWRVRDVVAHLVDGDLRTVSSYRDQYRQPPGQTIDSYNDLVAFINRLNAAWVDAALRLSPGVLLDLIKTFGPISAELLAGRPPHEPAPISVAWAGEDRSENWMHVGREYTERWHHQAQIRDAVGAPGLFDRKWLYPLLDFSMRALPHFYRSTESAEGTSISFTVSGEGGGMWTMVRQEGRWILYRGVTRDPAVTFHMDPETAWRHFYNALPAEEIPDAIRIEGERSLASPFLRTRSVMVHV